MAKTTQAGLIEKHVEKIVLAVALIILVVVGISWVASSPHGAEIPGLTADETLAPDEIDAALQDWARRTAEYIRNYNFQDEQEEVPEWTNQLRQRLSNPFLPDAIARVPLTPAAKPLEEGTIDIDKKLPHPLPPSPPLGKTLVKVEQGLVQWPGVGGAVVSARDMHVAHATCVMDYKTFIDRWRKPLEEVAVPFDVIFLSVAAERQERLPDGSWSPAVTVKGVQAPSRTLAIAVPEVPVFDGADYAGVLMQVQSFTTPGVQQMVLAPDFYPVYWPAVQAWGTWRHNLPETAVNQLPSAYVSPEHAAPTTGGGYVPGVEGPVIPPGMGGPVIPPGMGGPVIPPGMGGPVIPPGMGGGGYPGGTPGAPTPPAVPARPIVLPDVTKVPPLGNQCEAGIVQIWLHDPALEPGKTYRFRLKVDLFNPVFGQLAAVQNPADAQQPTLTSVSEWSDAVSVPPATQFYVGGGGIGSIRVDVFRRAQGATFRQSFSLKPGDMVGEPVVREYINPLTGRVDSTTVDFSTGCMLVDYDLTKTRPVSGFERPIIEAVFLRPEGDLMVRDKLTDDADLTRRKLTDEANDSDRAIRAAR